MAKFKFPKCVRVDADDEFGREALLSDGWREIETLVRMERLTEHFGTMTDGVERMTQETVLDVMLIAQNNLGPNRLLNDAALRSRQALKAATQIRGEYILEHPRDIYVFNRNGVGGYLAQNGNRLVFMAVSKKRQNIGSALVEAFIYRAYLWGHKKVVLGTQETNFRALALYKSRGFEIVGRQVTYHK